MRSAVAYLSDTSYSLYLVHFSLLIYLRTVPWLAHHPRVAIPVAFVLANAVALLYWYLIERHYPTVRRAVRRSGLWPTGPGIRAAHPLGDGNPAGSQTDESPGIRAGTRRRRPCSGRAHRRGRRALPPPPARVDVAAGTGPTTASAADLDQRGRAYLPCMKCQRPLCSSRPMNAGITSRSKSSTPERSKACSTK